MVKKKYFPHAFILALIVLVIVGVIFFLSTDVHTPPPEKTPANKTDDTETENTLPEDVPVQVGGAVDETLLESTYIIDDEGIAEKSELYELAPELTGLHGYINTNPEISLEDLRGKVVMIDFWTYSCINCIRTLPHVTEMHDKYAHQGLVIIGVHTPEFSFEEKFENVVDAVNKHGILYPVVLDNDYATWKAYKNRWWPRQYILDIDGFIRFDHIGEGAYDKIEAMIQQLLAERQERISENADVTPDMRLGYETLAGNVAYLNQVQPESIFEVTSPQIVKKHFLFLVGEWKYNSDNVELKSDTGNIFIAYEGSNVDIDAEALTESDVNLYLDTKTVSESSVGSDIGFAESGDSVFSVEDRKSYSIIDSDTMPGLLELQITGPGFKLYSVDFE